MSTEDYSTLIFYAILFIVSLVILIACCHRATRCHIV